MLFYSKKKVALFAGGGIMVTSTKEMDMQILGYLFLSLVFATTLACVAYAFYLTYKLIKNDLF